MPSYNPTQQARLDAGLCIDCAQPRESAGSTHVCCPLCAARRRERERARAARVPAEEATPPEVRARARADAQNARAVARYRERKDAGRCVRCGALPTARARLNRARLCDACRKSTHDYAVAARVRQRRESPEWRSQWGDARQGKPLPIGGAVTVGVVRCYHFAVDSGAFAALRELKRRDREARLQAATRGKGDGTVEVVYQIGRLLRDALRSWSDLSECPTRSPSYRQMIECKLTFGADAPTVAAVERHKAARDGNLSATICDLLVATAARPAYTPKRTTPRLSAGGGEVDPWDEE